MKWVTIIYKSGVKVRLRVHRFTATWDVSGEITKAEWDADKKGLKPLHIGLKNIESIYEGKLR